MYAKRTPAHVYSYLKYHGTSYIILEDSICLAASRDGCRLPDILDFANQHVSLDTAPMSDIFNKFSFNPQLIEDLAQDSHHTLYFGNQIFILVVTLNSVVTVSLSPIFVCCLLLLMGLHFSQIPDSGKEEEGLVDAYYPRFCDEIRHMRGDFAKLYKEVFVNKTFRVYQVLPTKIEEPAPKHPNDLPPVV